MTGLLRPFSGHMPSSDFGARVVGPPTATLTEEQREEARLDRFSFRHSAGRGARSSREAALDWLASCRDEGALLSVDDAVIVYRQRKDDFVATGFVADLSLEAYLTGRVKRHEKILAKTSRKMARYMRTTRVYGNPPVTASRPDHDLKALVAGHAKHQPDAAFTTVDGTVHELWAVAGDPAHELCGLVDTSLYITDGHHRLAAASLVASKENRTGARIPVGVFSADELKLRSFARCITGLALDTDTVISALKADNEVTEVESDEVRPRARYEFGIRIRDRYFRLRIPGERIPDDHYASLNTGLLRELILGPVFGIDEPGKDKRLRFVPDLSDASLANIDADVWLLPFPLTAEDVMAVADSDGTMPPKSTWFAPKVPSGLVIRPLDDN